MDRQRIDDAIDTDLRAFSRATARGVPSRDETARLAPHVAGERNRRRVARARWIMATAAAAVALVFVPVSYPVVRGATVTVTVTGSSSPDALAAIARGMGAAIGGDPERLPASAGGVRLRTRVRDVSARDARARAGAFAKRLADGGGVATVDVTPWVEAGNGNVYAFAGDRLQRFLIELRGKSSAEIEADVRARLEAAGFRDARVSVERDGGRTGVNIRATGEDGREFESEVRQDVRGSGADVPLPIEIGLPDLSEFDHLPLAQRRDAVAERLQELGIDAEVTIEDGHLRVERSETEQR